MSGPIEQNSSSGGSALLPEDPPEINHNNEEEEEADENEDDEEEEEEEDDEEDFLAGLPAVIRSRVDQLKKLNEKRDEYMEEYLKERAELERKYNALCQPLYDQRRDIINGASPGTENSVGNNEDEADKLSQEHVGSELPSESAATNEDTSEVKEDQIIGIPEFWTVAMSNIETIEELITERDTECLKYLEDITCEDFANGLGFTLKFHFKPNPYFSNSVLTKTYDVPNLLLMDDEPILKNVTGCTIDWKDGDVCLTHRVVCKKQRNKKGQIRHVKKNERTESFFHFFSPPKLPDMEEIDEEEADAIEEAFDHDYDVAQQFRSHIIPKGVLWFTGEAMTDALEEVYDGDDSLLNSRMQGMAMTDGATGDAATSEGGPFPPAANGFEEPECKQS